MTEKTAPNKKDVTGKNVSEMMPQIEKKSDIRHFFVEWMSAWGF